jgi:hypothetical protein
MGIVRGRAWWSLVGIAALILVFGVGDMVGGASVDPGIALGVSGLSPSELERQGAPAYRMFDFATRTQGWSLAVVGCLLLAILLLPYRSGERWAWWALWILPAWLFGVAALYLAFGLAPQRPLPPPLISGPILGAIAVTVLLLDRRRFAAAHEAPNKEPMEAPAWTGG